MKILLVNDRLKAGGAEIQTIREFRYFTEKGHDVYLLTFDGDYDFQMTGHRFNIPTNRNNIEKAIYRVLPCPEEKLIRKIVDSVCPEVIHLNNVYSASCSLFKIIRRYPTVQTVRDYSIICPKSTCVTRDGKPCKGYSLLKCLRCSALDIEGIVRTAIHAKYNKKRGKAVDVLLAPSKALADAASNASHVVGILNNPFDFSCEASLSYEKVCNRVFFSYGRISEEKGFSSLLEAWQDFSRDNPSARLLIAGNIEPNYKARYLQLIEQQKTVRYLGALDYSKIMELYAEVFCVVVPSIWMENYPNTVLEALANKTIVIGSARGGIPEMIGDSRFIFEPTDRRSILNALKLANNMDRESYLSVVTANYKRVRESNSQEKYYESLIGIYDDLISR